jgi:hypothetical protein
MRQSLSNPETNPRILAITDALDHLTHTKMRGVTYIERWQKQTKDLEIRVGLEAQLIDERRHSRLLNEEMRRLVKGPVGPRVPPAGLGGLYREIDSLETDLHKLCVFHRGIKAFTLNRCSHLIPVVEPSMSRMLEQVAREEERHIRWADIRLARLLTHEEMRTCNLLMSRVWAVLEASWERTWRDLAHSTQMPAAASS